MAAAALRFLAHCFKMTLPVSLSTSAARGRISIFSLTVAARSPLALPPPGFLSIPLSLALPRSLVFLRAGCSHVTASLELLAWGMGGIEREEEGWRGG